jgi:hypothetical protein
MTGLLAGFGRWHGSAACSRTSIFTAALSTPGSTCSFSQAYTGLSNFDGNFFQSISARDFGGDTGT